MDPVSSYSELKLLVKEQVSLKSKIRFGCLTFVIFIIPVFYFDQSSAHLLMFRKCVQRYSKIYQNEPKHILF